MATNSNMADKIHMLAIVIRAVRCLCFMLYKGQEVSKDELTEEDKENHNQVYYTANKRIVYGGGGITPDIDIQNDFLTNLSAELRRKNVFFNFAVDYLVDHDHQVSKNPVITDKIMNDFLAYASKEGVKYTPADLDSARAYIENTIKSELVRKVYGDSDAYRITLAQDKQLAKAIELFVRFKDLKEMFAYSENRSKLR